MTTTNRALSLTALLACSALGLVALGCEGEKAAPAAAGSSAPAAAAKPTSAAAAAPAAAKVELEEVKNEKMGYTIKLPKGASQSMNDQNGGMYGHDTMMIKVEPVGVALASPDDLLRGVSTDGGTVDKKTEGDAFIVVVTRPNAPTNIYAGPKGAKIASMCMTEPSMKDLGIQICSSLKATK